MLAVPPPSCQYQIASGAHETEQRRSIPVPMRPFRSHALAGSQTLTGNDQTESAREGQKRVSRSRKRARGSEDQTDQDGNDITGHSRIGPAVAAASNSSEYEQDSTRARKRVPQTIQDKSDGKHDNKARGQLAPTGPVNNAMGHSDNHNHPAIDETSDSAIAEHPTVPGEGFCRPEDLNRPESAPAPTVIYAWALQEAQEGTLFATTVAATTALSSGEFDPAVDNPPPVPAHVLAGLESPPFRFPQAGVNPFVGATAAAAAASSRLGDDMNDEDSHNGGDENDNYDMLVPPPCLPELPAEGVEVPPALPHTICDSIRFDCDGGDDDKAVVILNHNKQSRCTLQTEEHWVHLSWK